MRIQIKANTKEMETRLGNLVKKQMPFALSRSVTKTATLTRDEQLFTEYNKFFEMRNKPFFKSVHAVAASDLRFAKQTGVAIAAIQPQDAPRPVGTTRGGRGRKANTEFMKRHVTGGVKAPKGKLIAIPFSKAGIPRKKGGRTAGAIVKGKQPTALLNGRGFINKTTKGKIILFRKVGRGKSAKNEAMYHLKPAATIKGGYNPIRAARVGVKKWFEPTFKKNFIRALRTAKLR